MFCWHLIFIILLAIQLQVESTTTTIHNVANTTIIDAAATTATAAAAAAVATITAVTATSTLLNDIVRIGDGSVITRVSLNKKIA